MLNRIGIRKENIDLTEKRTPLIPSQVAELVSREKVEVVVEPAPNRIFGEEEFRQSGAKISKDLGDCNIIFGVKEIPIPDFLPKKAYCFFSHTIKGQKYNMPILKHILDLRCTLIDYEKVENDRGQRLIFFGRFAGYAGMIDSLWSLGGRLQWEGIENPFSSIHQASTYNSLEEAKTALLQVGDQIRLIGLPEQISPLVCGFAGYGQVSQGAQEIFDLLPVEDLSPAYLLNPDHLKNLSSKKVYKVIFREEDMFHPTDPNRNFDLQEYYRHPEKYTGVFENYLPGLTILVNGIYWEPRYPKLVTKSYLKQMYSSGSSPRLRVIGDITCDIEGSIECNLRATNSENPIYVYHPQSGTTSDGWEGSGLVVLAVDKLPSELPREASETFGNALTPFVKALANTDFNLPFDQLRLPPEMKRAVIAHNGFLTPDYKYLEKHIR